MQLQPAAPGRARQGRHPRGRRHADGVQHDLGERRRVDGDRGHEGLADQPRGRRRLDRAGRPRPPARWRGLPGRLRQDDPGRRDGARPARPARRDPLQRHDLSGHVQGPAERDRRHGLRGDRGVSGREDHARRAVRDRAGRLPGPRRVRRPVHRQHDVDGHGVHGPLARRPQRHPGRGPGQGRGGTTDRRAGHGPRPPRRPAIRRSSPASRSRTASRRWPRPAAPPTACSTCSPSPTSSASRSTSTSSAPSPTARRSSPTCIQAAATRRPTCTTRAAWSSSCASCSSATACSTATRPTVDGRTIARDRGRGDGDAGPEGGPADRDPVQGDRWPRDPPRDARPGGLRGQARRPRAHAAPRPGPGVRLGDGVLRGGQGAAHRARRRRRDPLGRPRRRTGHAGDAERDERPRR